MEKERTSVYYSITGEDVWTGGVLAGFVTRSGPFFAFEDEDGSESVHERHRSWP